jgi:hypothetical protein
MADRWLLLVETEETAEAPGVVGDNTNNGVW